MSKVEVWVDGVLISRRQSNFGPPDPNPEPDYDCGYAVFGPGGPDMVRNENTLKGHEPDCHYVNAHCLPQDEWTGGLGFTACHACMPGY